MFLVLHAGIMEKAIGLLKYLTSPETKYMYLHEDETIGGIVSKETVCCVGGKVKH